MTLRRRRKRPCEGNDNVEQPIMERRAQADEGGNFTYYDDIINSNNTSVDEEEGSAVQYIDETFRRAHLLSMFAAPLGDPTLLGVSEELGAFLAMMHLNERSGAVLPNLPERLEGCNLYFTFDLLETNESPTKAVGELLKNIPQEPKPMGIVGSSTSVTSESLSIISAVNKIAQTSCCATSQELDDKSQHPYFSRTVPTNRGNARAAALYYKAIGIKHVADLHVEDVYGVEFSRLFREEAERLEIDVFPVSFRAGFEHSVQQAVKQIKSSNRTYVFGMLYAATLIQIADIASQADIMGPESGYVWILGEGNSRLSLNTTDPGERPRLLNATNGMGWIELYVPPNERYNTVVEFFKADMELQEYYLSKKEIPQEANFNLSNVYAPDFALLNYDAAITMGIAACEVDDDFFSAADVFNSVVRLEFQGASGHVVFDNFTGTRLVTDVRYTVQNLLSSPDPNNDEIILLESITSAIIDLDATDSDDVVEIVRPFVYAGNTTNQPPPLPAVEHNPYLIPNWALGLGLLFCVTMMAMSIGWCAWTLVNRKQRMVRASQPFFLVMLCIGTFLIASSIIPTSFQEPMSEIALNVGCMLSPWLLYTGYVTAFSALFTKNGRINAVFVNAQAFRRVTIRPKDVILPFVVLMSLNWILLILWTALAPWKWDREELGGVDTYGRTTESYGVCVSDNETLAKVFLSLLAVVNVTPIVLANYQSYKCRNLPSEFNESRYVTMSMASLLESFCIGLPILLVAVNPTAVFLTRAVVLCMTCLAILLPMFVPKFLNRDGPAPPPRQVRTSTAEPDQSCASQEVN